MKPRRLPFRIADVAQLKHLNVRKQGPEDNKILTVDIKLEFEKIDGRLVAYFSDALDAFLWRDQAKIVRHPYMEPLEFSNELEGATVTVEGHRFFGCDVRKFRISPKDGGTITLGLTVSFAPTSLEVGDLAKKVQDGARVMIEAAPDLFDTQAPSEVADAAAAAAFDTLV